MMPMLTLLDVTALPVPKTAAMKLATPSIKIPDGVETNRTLAFDVQSHIDLYTLQMWWGGYEGEV